MEKDKSIVISTGYYFFNMDDAQVEQFKSDLEALAEKCGTRGLIITGKEGMNTTFSNSQETADEFKAGLCNLVGTDVWFKDSYNHKHPFNEFKVKIRKEIVTIGREDFLPNNQNTHHLSPAEWDRVLKEEDPIVIDTRNDYEVEIGKFKTAHDPKIQEFTQFGDYVKSQNFDKDKKVLIYCTGGIRCEKGIYEMKEQGFNNVYQLEGGIINYLKEYPNEEFEGECFVFDYRVSVDQELNQTSKYRLCPHCGQPSGKKIECIQCGEEEYVCQKCIDSDPHLETCSKNCAHHHRLGHKTRRPHLDGKNRRHDF